ncbi:MAG: hypothetical protein H0U03_00525 [Actinobacteria bacterium]|nr:hypothetical protein [Actinomycetota bacterium]
MRKFLLFAALAALFVLPAIGSAVRAAPKDGTLSIKNGDGMVFINGSGAVIAQVEKVFKPGGITLTDIVEEGSGATFTGCEWSKETETASGVGTVTYCRGTNIRFKLIGGQYKLRITNAKGINLSAVGRSRVDQVHLDGDGEALGDDDGTFSFDGDLPYKSLPNKLDKFQLGSS